MFNYTYKIYNILSHKSYIGVRSSCVDPELDIGIKYFSSSSDTEFMDEQKEHQFNFIYDILGIFDTRQEAIGHEIYLHNFYDVGVNSMFYNKAKQSSSGYDTSGMKFPLHSEFMKHNNPGATAGGKQRTRDAWKDGKYTDQSILKMSSNPSKGDAHYTKNISKEDHPRYGISHTQASKIKMSKNSVGKGTKERSRWWGKHLPEEMKRKISDTLKNKPMQICPHCLFESNSIGNLKRWHFENCKDKK